MSFDHFKKTVGFTKNPDRPGNSDAAFMGFISFVNGDSKEAQSIRLEFTQGRDSSKETPQQTAAAFIDWLITNHWGEAA